MNCQVIFELLMGKLIPALHSKVFISMASLIIGATLSFIANILLTNKKHKFELEKIERNIVRKDFEKKREKAEELIQLVYSLYNILTGQANKMFVKNKLNGEFDKLELDEYEQKISYVDTLVALYFPELNSKKKFFLSKTTRVYELLYLNNESYLDKATSITDELKSSTENFVTAIKDKTQNNVEESKSNT